MAERPTVKRDIPVALENLVDELLRFFAIKAKGSVQAHFSGIDEPPKVKLELWVGNDRDRNRKLEDL